MEFQKAREKREKYWRRTPGVDVGELPFAGVDNEQLPSAGVDSAEMPSAGVDNAQ